MEKICRLCNIPKGLNKFHKKKGTKDGYRNECKECVKEIQKKYKEAPDFKEKRANYDKNRYDNNREEILERKKVYHLENRDKILEYKKEYRNIPGNKEKAKNYIKNNPDINSNNQSIYREKYPHIILWRSILYRVLDQFGTEKSSRTIDMLGYSADELRENINTKFTIGMNWDNHGKWHLDHIVPVCLFREDTPVNIVNSLENLRPLWSEDNLEKSINIGEGIDRFINENYEYLK